MELIFEKVEDQYEAKFQSDTDVKIQLIFAEGVISKVTLLRSLDTEHYDIAGISRDSNCPIVQTQGASAGDYFKLRCLQMPEKVICVELE